MKEDILKIAIIGCGKIADDHVSAIQFLPDCKVVAVCDNDELMAWQLADRLGISKYFARAEDLLRECKPDVVHITTPPQSHFSLGRLCVEAGCHVFIEKPFTVYANEARDLLQLARAKGVKVTAGHNHQFSPVALRMRGLINKGTIGGAPVHLESMFTYELGDRYAAALIGDKNHWVRRLPGGLPQNVISHAVSKIAEYLPGDSPAVKVHGFQSPQLMRLGGADIIDELRVIVGDQSGITAFLTFSSQIKPQRHEFRAFGSKGYVIADHSHQLLLIGVKKSFKIQLNTFFPPFLLAKQLIREGFGNIGRFLAGRSHMDSGRRVLLSRFYDCIRDGSEPPIPYREIVLTGRIMDDIFAQLQDNQKKSPDHDEVIPRRELVH